MIRVTKLTDYGIVLMTRLAKRAYKEQVTAPELSRDMGMPLPTIRKILKILTASRLLVSTRGIGGGYRLAHNPEDITLLNLVEALEGPLSLTDCSSGIPCECKIENCGLGNNWKFINQIMQNTLSSYSLAQMASSLPEIPQTLDLRGHR